MAHNENDFMPPGAVSLSGGVASDIYVVGSGADAYVVKRALSKLRVEAEWLANPSRSSVEVDALQAIGKLLGPASVPQILWVDAVRNMFGMQFIESRFRNWKSELLSGNINIATARRIGSMLGDLHSKSARDALIAKRFDNISYFEELRIKPYFESIAKRNPLASANIFATIEDLRLNRTSLVHGDFSPKNILADREEVVFLDCEVAHWGNPRFDIGFVICHLVLKSFRKDINDRSDLIFAAMELLKSYGINGPNVIDMQLTRILGCLILARLEGDSPVEYLEDLDIKTLKSVAIRLIAFPPEKLATVLEAIGDHH